MFSNFDSIYKVPLTYYTAEHSNDDFIIAMCNFFGEKKKGKEIFFVCVNNEAPKTF